MFSKTPAINRPEKYKPDMIYPIMLYYLHSHLTYLNPLKLTKSNNDTFYGHQFKRDDGIVVNYFYAIQDEVDNRPPESSLGKGHPILDEFITMCVNAKILTPNSITIAPLEQIQLNRAHFNTILIYTSPTAVHAYLIEPRSNDITSRLVSYPTDSLLDDIKRELIIPNSTINVSSIKVGRQPLHDDKTCGAHHINFSELITKLPTPIIESANKLKKSLATTSLTTRNNDNQILASMRGKLQSYMDINLPPENGFIDISAPIKVMKTDIDPDGFYDGEYADVKSIDDLEFQNQLTNLHIKTQSNETLQSAIDSINQYTEHQSLFSLFRSHTRHKTKDLITSALSTLQTDNDPASIVKSSILLLATFNSISDKTSRLRINIGEAVSTLLDCKLEYSIKQDKLFEVDPLFKAKFKLLISSFDETQIDQYKSDLSKITRIMDDINSLDTKLIDKIAEPVDRDADRAALFAQVKTILQINMAPDLQAKLD